VYVYFEEAEWKAVMMFTTRAQFHQQSLRRCAMHCAVWQGWEGSWAQGDGEPGTQSLWLGLQRLDDIVACGGHGRCDTTPRVPAGAIPGKDQAEPGWQ